MRKLFPGYYAPTKADYQQLWTEGLIVLDTNVLLDLYRLPATARDELMDVFNALRDRIWIPHHVALEFQRRRLTVIAAERKAIEEVLSEVTSQFDAVNKKVVSLQIEKRGLGIDPNPLIQELRSANEKLVDAVQKAHQSQLDIAVSDPVREKLDELLQGKIGPGPKNQDELNGLIIDGEDRYKNKIPPGYEDAEKDKNPSEAVFYHDDLIYSRKMGDLIIWRQLINHAKVEGVKSVLLVTSDRKEDWWWREKGKTIGPRPELAREIEKCADVGLFWMYSSSQFLENAKPFTEVDISEQSVTQLEQVARFSQWASDDRTRLRFKRLLSNYGTHFEESESRLSDAKVAFAVRRWLTDRFNRVVMSDGFPDFLVKTHEGLHGFEVKYVKTADALLAEEMRREMVRGALALEEGDISAFTIIVVLDEDESRILLDEDEREVIELSMKRMISPYPVEEVIVGFIASTGNFYDVFRVGRFGDDVFS